MSMLPERLPLGLFGVGMKQGEVLHIGYASENRHTLFLLCPASPSWRPVEIVTFSFLRANPGSICKRCLKVLNDTVVGGV